MIIILIEQLDAQGSTWRIFTHQCRDWELDGRLQAIERGYNMVRTRVTVRGHDASQA